MRHLTLLKAIATTHTNTYTEHNGHILRGVRDMILVVFLIALGKKTEVICLLLEARGLPIDQHDVLMFKLDFSLRRQRAAAGWRNENGILLKKQATALISSQHVVLLLTTSIRYTRVVSVEYS